MDVGFEIINSVYVRKDHNLFLRIIPLTARWSNGAGWEPPILTQNDAATESVRDRVCRVRAGPTATIVGGGTRRVKSVHVGPHGVGLLPIQTSVPVCKAQGAKRRQRVLIVGETGTRR